MKIFLADLVHKTVRSTYVVPLNIGYLAATLDEYHNHAHQIRLFKYPVDLEKALESDPPDLLGLSHYSWNSRLNEHFSQTAKNLRSDCRVVWGGPNVRTDPAGLERFFRQRPAVDVYVVHAGENAFCELVDALAGGRDAGRVKGCAVFEKGRLTYHPARPEKDKPFGEISPYLKGWLDPFLADPDLIPLVETNRGCPYGCAYCNWGAAALSKVYLKPMDIVLAELDYIAENAACDKYWIFCDANFGLFPRDMIIAQKAREIIERTGRPSYLHLASAKNNSRRDIEINEILEGRTAGYLAIQSADPIVLKNSERTNLSEAEIRSIIDHYHQKGLRIKTDLLIGLPGETPASHLFSLTKAFELGFDEINVYEIRLLPGSKYESDQFRERFAVKTRFRPIFGGYGRYGGRRVFEMEESVRGTADMTESDLLDFKALHWLVSLTWNAGLMKTLLQFGRSRGVNPAVALKDVTEEQGGRVGELLSRLKREAAEEWFSAEADLIDYYDQPENFQCLVDGFVKLNQYYVAQAFLDPDFPSALRASVTRVLEARLDPLADVEKDLFQAAGLLTKDLICRDLLEDARPIRREYPAEIVGLALNRSDLKGTAPITMELFRSPRVVEYCRAGLIINGRADYSKQNLTRFFETGGKGVLLREIRLPGEKAGNEHP